MVLTIDIGNSNIVIGGYQNGAIGFMARLATEHNREADQYAVEIGSILHLYGVQKGAIVGMVLSSVVPGLTQVVADALTHFTGIKPMLFTLAHTGPITIDIENPAELGTDILASALAVQQNFPLPAVIIDMGTATKLIAVDSQARLRGVSIAPGLFVSFKALLGSTSLSRSISLSAPPVAIGRNTLQSMQSGVVLGSAAMLDGMIDRFAAEMGEVATIIATGGAAPLAVPHCRHAIQCSDTLLLDGLFLAYSNNHPQ